MSSSTHNLIRRRGGESNRTLDKIYCDIIQYLDEIVARDNYDESQIDALISVDNFRISLQALSAETQQQKRRNVDPELQTMLKHNLYEIESQLQGLQEVFKNPTLISTRSSEM